MKRIRNAERMYRLEGLVIEFQEKGSFPALLVQSDQNKILPIVFGDTWCGCAAAVVLNTHTYFTDQRNASKQEIYEKFAKIKGGIKRIRDNSGKVLRVSLVKGS